MKRNTIQRWIKTIALIGLVGVAAPLLLEAQQIETYNFTTNRMVPDGNAAGLADVRNINSDIGKIGSVSVRLKINGEFNGDLYGYLRHVQNGVTNFCILLNRPGKTAADSAGYPDSGLDLTFRDDATNGDIHVYRDVVVPVAGSPLTGEWQPDGRLVDPADVTEASLRETSLTNFDGVSAQGEWTLYLVDLENGGTNMLRGWGLDLSGSVNPSLAWPTPADIVYGTALGASQLNATATFNSTNVNGTFTYSIPTGAVLNAGSNQTLTVTFTPADTAGFLPVSTNIVLNVLKAPLNIAANSTSKVYGDALPTFTANYTGFVNGDTDVNLGTPVSLTTAANSSTGVGTYAITASGATSANYDITFVDGTLNVTPAALTITANSASKPYGAALPTFIASYIGLVNGDTVTSLATPVSLTTAASATSDVGIYAITASGATDSNYAINFVDGTLTIDPVTITVTAQDKAKVYGAPLPEFTATYTGFVLGQGVGSLTTPATFSTTATSSSDVGTYPITASGATSPNYAFAYVGGTLTIGQSSIVGAVASSANPALPGANVTFTMTVSAVAPGANTPGGTVNFRIDGSIAGSGTLSSGEATFVINTLTHGTHTVVAEYPGDGNFFGTTNALTPAEVVNTAPVAGANTIERYATQGVKVSVTTLLANDTDPDGDTLNFSVGSASANGATITFTNGWVYYTPVAGFTNVDTFTYTITDGTGGSAIGTVTVGIKVDNEPGVNLTITVLGNGSVKVVGNGIPGRTYRLQYSDNLSSANWLDLLSVTADSVGRFVYTDTTGSAERFYRTVYP